MCSTLGELVALAAKKLQLPPDAKDYRLCVMVCDTEVNLEKDADLHDLNANDKVT